MRLREGDDDCIMNSPDFVSFASETARDAGELLVRYLAKNVAVEYKGSFDLVTAADRASEELVVGRIRSRFPSHSIVAEEGTGIDQGSEYVWHVDPLDGTTNFAHAYPWFCCSIGLEKNGEAIVGAVFDPNRQEMFTAEKGAGAYLNNRRLRVSTIDSLANGLYATGFPPYNRLENPNAWYFHQFSVLTHGCRRSGSAALDLCSVAAGRLEGFWEMGLKSWDVSGGSVIVREAGGRVTDMEGGPHRSSDPHVATSNGLVHPAMIELFAKIRRGELEAALPPPNAP